MELFAAAARHGNFSKAARNAGLSPASVSRIIGDFEAHLGVQLFNRTSRSLALTQAGRIYLQRIEPLLDAIRMADAEAGAFQQRPAGRLRVHSRLMFGHRVLAPLIPAFQAANPKVKVLLDYSQDFVAQAKCKEKALNQIANSAGVVFQVAGQCGLGVLDAAKEKQVLGIGVDADQGYLGRQVMTSALKRVDTAVFAAIQAAKTGKLKGGNVTFGAAQNGVGYGSWSKSVPPSIKAAVAAQLKLLKAGKIKGIPSAVK